MLLKFKTVALYWIINKFSCCKNHRILRQWQETDSWSNLLDWLIHLTLKAIQCSTCVNFNQHFARYISQLKGISNKIQIDQREIISKAHHLQLNLKNCRERSIVSKKCPSLLKCKLYVKRQCPNGIISYYFIRMNSKAELAIQNTVLLLSRHTRNCYECKSSIKFRSSILGPMNMF